MSNFITTSMILGTQCAHSCIFQTVILNFLENSILFLTYNNMASPEEWYRGLPKFTKLYFTTAVGTTVLTSMGALDPFLLLELSPSPHFLFSYFFLFFSSFSRSPFSSYLLLFLSLLIYFMKQGCRL